MNREGWSLAGTVPAEGPRFVERLVTLRIVRADVRFVEDLGALLGLPLAVDVAGVPMRGRVTRVDLHPGGETVGLTVLVDGAEL